MSSKTQQGLLLDICDNCFDLLGMQISTSIKEELVKFRKTVDFEMSFYNFRQISNLHFALPMAWGVVVGIPTSLIGMISSYDRWVYTGHHCIGHEIK